MHTVDERAGYCRCSPLDVNHCAARVSCRDRRCCTPGARAELRVILYSWELHGCMCFIHRTDLKIRSRRHFYAFARSFPFALLLGSRSGDRGDRGWWGLPQKGRRPRRDHHFCAFAPRSTARARFSTLGGGLRLRVVLRFCSGTPRVLLQR